MRQQLRRKEETGRTIGMEEAGRTIGKEESGKNNREGSNFNFSIFVNLFAVFLTDYILQFNPQ